MVKRVRDIIQLAVVYPLASHAAEKRWYRIILSVSRSLTIVSIAQREARTIRERRSNSSAPSNTLL